MVFKFDDRDEFNIKPIAEKIVDLVDSDIQISPLVIYWPWGCGKTEFCLKMLYLAEEKESKKDDNSEVIGYRWIYINSYQNDYCYNPF